jgi:low molecular weight protein-tyrosine phosphatase
MRVLFVCTGNICRSPLAERLLRSWARDALGAGAADLTVGSAGTAAIDGTPMDPHSAQVLTELGGSPEGFRARRLVPGEAVDADLVLTMSRAQRRLVLHSDPRSLRRVFTLPEAAGLLPLADREGLPLLPVPERARELAVRLDAARAHRRGTDEDDVRDPIGRPLEVHRQVAARIAGALRPLADVLVLPLSVTVPAPAETEPRGRPTPATGARATTRPRDSRQTTGATSARGAAPSGLLSWCS